MRKNSKGCGGKIYFAPPQFHFLCGTISPRRATKLAGGEPNPFSSEPLASEAQYLEMSSTATGIDTATATSSLSTDRPSSSQPSVRATSDPAARYRLPERYRVPTLLLGPTGQAQLPQFSHVIGEFMGFMLGKFDTFLHSRPARAEHVKGVSNDVRDMSAAVRELTEVVKANTEAVKAMMVAEHERSQRVAEETFAATSEVAGYHETAPAAPTTQSEEVEHSEELP